MTADPIPGLCVAHPYDPALWDHDVHGETAAQRDRRHRLAAEVCHRCPMQPSCASVPAEGHEGVWGGRVLPGIPLPVVQHAYRRDLERERLVMDMSRDGLTLQEIADRLQATTRYVSRVRARHREGVAA